ncbi:patatin-like phospholipase family protein [Sagittula sp. SSi028]|uniref:patatin-like phospholipase family protein n=1 Tax=Sagittula sp. SSi028 TaxID=3400636 RepID=UPI003AF53A78
MSKLGLALGAGGARGWCHIGALKAMRDMGVEPDVVAGCSIGALVGAAWAGGKLDALEEWSRGLTQAKFLQYLDLRMAGGGFVEGKAVAQLLSDIGLPERIEDLDKPYLAVACDMATGREVWLHEGNLADAVRASVSIPGIFTPTKVRGRWLLDGGLINPVPSSAVRALGADCCIAINPDAPPEDGVLWEPQDRPGLWDKMGVSSLRNALPAQLAGVLPEGGRREPTPAYGEVLSVSIGIMMEFMRKAREAADPPDLTIKGELVHISILELYRAAEAIDIGAAMTRERADRIIALAQRSCGVLEDPAQPFTAPPESIAAE